MPPGTLDEISLAIGELRSEIHGSNEARNRIEKKLTCLDLKLDQVLPLVPKVAALELSSDEYKTFRNRGLGAFAVIGFGASMFGAGVLDWVKAHFQ